MGEISKAAQKTLDLINKGRFYMCYGANPKTIDELVKAGFIRRGARATQYVSAYIPTNGYIPMRNEAFDYEGDHWSNALKENAADDLYNALWEAVELSDRTLPPSGRTDECQRVYDLCRAALAKAEGN